MIRLTVVVMVAALLELATPGAQSKSQDDLLRAGWDALNAGRSQEAATTFGQALKAGPPTAPLLLGAGLAAHLQTRYEEARQHLVAALGLDPSLLAASILLGDVLYRSGDLDGAVLVYEQAQVRVPDHPQITKKLEAWRRELALHSKFGQRFSDHFTVLFEGPAEAPLAQHAVAVLEAAYWRIGTALSTYPVDVVTVVLYTREQFRDVTQSPEWAGGAFDGRIRVPVQGALENTREFDRVLTHEFTHALIHSVAPRGVPTWLNEGLAVLFEGSSLAKQTERVRGAASPLPLDRLDGSFAKLNPAQATLAYAQSAVAAGALMDQAGAAAVVSLLADIGTGTSFAGAFARHIPIGFGEFQKKLWGDTP